MSRKSGWSVSLGFAAAAVLAVGLSVVAVPLSASAASTTYYVATTGSDANAGTVGAPFKTIQKCATVALAGDTCLINSGTYRETVAPTHSGSAGSPITFAPVTGASVTVDGTNAVSGWTLDSGKIYKAAVTLSGTAAAPYSSTEYPSNTNLWANEIFQGSTFVPEAAYPTPVTDPFNQSYVKSGWSSTRSSSNTCGTPPCTTTLTGTLTENSFPALGDMTGTVAYFTGGWVALSAQITSGTLTATNHKLNMSFPESDAKVEPGGGNVNQFRLVGSKSFLTAPGEWYYDAGAHELYMWASNNAVPSNVYAKARNYSFDLSNHAYIVVQGINTFSNAITMNDASSNNVINGLTASYLSQWQTAQYDSTIPFDGIYDANHHFDSGIVLHGNNETLENSTITESAGNGVNIDGSGDTLNNNLIHDVSYNGTYTSAISIQVGAQNDAITHNSMFNTGRDVINMDTNSYPNAGFHNLHIAYNDIEGYAKISFDLGGIYSCCDTSLAGTEIDHNLIHDPANTGNGIHLDNGSYDLTIDHNAIYNLKGTGDINHGGNGINFGGHTNAPPAGSNLPYLTGSIYDNTIVTGANDTIFNYFASSGYDANTIVKNDILDGAHPTGQDYGYVAGGTPQEATNLVTTISSDGTGTDPKFIDPSSGNFGLQTTSPAIDAGSVISPYTNAYAGSAPDIGAFESGVQEWTAGCTFTGCLGTALGSKTTITGYGGLCVDDSANKQINGNPIEVYHCTGSANQQWTLVETGNGEIQTLGGCMTESATNTVVWSTCVGSTAQRWTLEEDGTVLNGANGLCLDDNAHGGSGTPLIVYQCTAANNQQWAF
jgi:Ricin-type beta-trefoil lectin domain